MKVKRTEAGEPLNGFSVRLSRLAKRDGGGWLAEVPDLPGCFSDGETPADALLSVQDAIEGWVESARANGQHVPEPTVRSDAEFSGKFTLRIPKSLHRFLARESEEEGVSLNQYVLSLVTYNAATRAFGRESTPVVSPRNPSGFAYTMETASEAYGKDEPARGRNSTKKR